MTDNPWILLGKVAERLRVVERKLDLVSKDIETAKAWAIRFLIAIAISGSWLGTALNVSPQELGEKIATVINALR